MNKNIYVLYHADCPDGFGAAFAAWMRFGGLATYLPVKYQQPVPDLEPGSQVYIVDFSYPEKILRAMEEEMETVVVLDHHETAQADLARLVEEAPDRYIFNMKKSGAVLAWEYFHKGTHMATVPIFILYLQDRDLWQWWLPESRAFSAGLASRPKSFQAWQSLCYGHDSIDILIGEGRGILGFQEQQLDLLKRNVRWMVFDVERRDIKPTKHRSMDTTGGIYAAPVCNTALLQSELGEVLRHEFPFAPFSASYFDQADGKRKWSLRAGVDGFDVSVVAKAFGGGGHKAAAGFDVRMSEAYIEPPTAEPSQAPTAKDQEPKAYV